MTEELIKKLAIEYAVSCLKAECRVFNYGYDIDTFFLKTEWNGDHALVYLCDGEEEIELAEIGFDDVATVIKYPRVYTQEAFYGMADKHNLIKSAPIETQVQEGENNECQETN